MSVEGVPSILSQGNSNSPTVIGQRPLDGDVAGFFEGGELLGECRVREGQTIAHEGKIRPVCGCQKGHYGQAGAWMNELVEARFGHLVTTAFSASTNCGHEGWASHEKKCSDNDAGPRGWMQRTVGVKEKSHDDRDRGHDNQQ